MMAQLRWHGRAHFKQHIGDQEDIGTGPDQDPVLGTTADQDPVLEEWVRKLVAEWAVASARQSH